MKVGSALPEPPVRGVRHVPDLPGTPPEGGREHPHRLEPLPRRPEGAGRDPRPALVPTAPPPQQGENRGSFRFDDRDHGDRRRPPPPAAPCSSSPRTSWTASCGSRRTGRRYCGVRATTSSTANASSPWNSSATPTRPPCPSTSVLWPCSTTSSTSHPGRQRRDRCRQHGLHARRDPAHTGRGAGAGRRLRRRGTGRG